MDENLRRVFDRTRPSPEQKEAMLNRLLEPERKVKPMKKLKKLTVLGVAAALMVVTCAAAVVTGVDQRLLDYFGAKPEDAELLAPGAVAVDVAAEDNGAAFHVSQVLMDRYSLMLLAEFTAPEGVSLDNKGDPFAMLGDFELNFLNQAGEPCSEDGLSGWSFMINCLEDEDPLDNRMTLLLDLRLNQDMDCLDTAFFRLSFTDFGWFNPDLPGFVSLCPGTWSCDIPLPQHDIGQTRELNLPVGELDGAGITVKEIYLSPMTLRIILSRDTPANSENMTDEDEQIYSRWMSAMNINRIDLTDRSGRTIPLRGNGGSIDDQENIEIYRLEEITALSQLQGGVLTLRIGDGSVDIPLDGLVPAE